MALSHTLFNGGVANVSSFNVTHTPRASPSQGVFLFMPWMSGDGVAPS